MILPTVGRVVWVWTDGADFHSTSAPVLTDPEQPMAGIVARVWDERKINIAAFDHDGKPFSVNFVPLLQDDDPIPERGTYAAWMPYQKGQAARTQELEAQVATQVVAQSTEGSAA